MSGSHHKAIFGPVWARQATSDQSGRHEGVLIKARGTEEMRSVTARMNSKSERKGEGERTRKREREGKREGRCRGTQRERHQDREGATASHDDMQGSIVAW